MNRIVLVIIILFVASALSESNSASAQSRTKASKCERVLYLDSTAAIDERVDDLLSRMTLDEKIGQLIMPFGWTMYDKESGTARINDQFKARMKEQSLGAMWCLMRADPWTQKTLANGLTPDEAARLVEQMQRYAIEQTRLGIPLFIAEECAHGVMAIGATTFPTGIAQAATFNPSLMNLLGTAVGAEAITMGCNVAFGPVVDISRDARWSRVEENFGEDPFLAGVMAGAFVRGLQSVEDGKLISTLKHFAAYGASEGGLNGEQSTVGMRTLLSVYVEAFRMCVADGAQMVMTSYNSIDGIPCTANETLLDELLRATWGFKGLVISDLHSIEGIARRHHVAVDDVEAAAMALKAGVDIDLEGGAYSRLKQAIDRKLCDESDVDRAVRRVLRCKFAMRLFENPYPSKCCEVNGEEHREIAYQVALESVTLLKNSGVLPLSEPKRLLVAGPNADAVYNQLGDYTAPQADAKVVTILKGLKSRLPRSEIKYAKGCSVRDTADASRTIAEAVKAASDVDAIVCVVGGSSARDFKTEYINTGAALTSVQSISDMDNGEGFDRSTLSLLGAQDALIEALASTGKPLVVIYIQGRPMEMNRASEQADALLSAWYPGERGGEAVADVLLGNYNPSGRLPISVPRSVGQIPVYYSRPQSHDYVEGESAPLYPFGYGLSYTRFEYSDLQAECSLVDSVVKIRFKVRNIGDVDGAEVAQVYFRDEVSSVSVPAMQLAAFKKEHIAAGGEKTIELEIPFDRFALYDKNLNRVVEKGRFEIMVGSSSCDVRLRTKVEL